VGGIYTWYDADDYCLYHHGSHLATIKSEAQNNEVVNICRDLGEYDCWIGLNNFDFYLTYKWINDSSEANNYYTKWYPIANILSPYVNLNAAKITALGAGYGRYWVNIEAYKWAEAFICDPLNTASSPSTIGYIPVSQAMSFTDANNFCLTNYFSTLAVIRNEQENNEFANLCRSLGNAYCWIGYTDSITEGY